MDYILLGAPMYVNWNYTYRCNFNCIHCYSRTRTHTNELTYKDKLRVADNLIRNKVFIVNLGGGEPLLCEDCVDIIRYMTSHGIAVNLSSNGWKTSDEQIASLKKAGLNGVSISIDHVDEHIHDAVRNQQGSFQEACKTIRKYVSADIKVYISTTITSKNYDALEDIIRLGVSLGAYGVDLKRVKTMGNALDRNDLELTNIEQNVLYTNIPIWKENYPINISLVYGTKRIEGIDAGCPCGKTSLAIMSNGDISPCVYNSYTIGNAVRDDIHDIWCNSDALKYLRTNYSCLGLARKESSMYSLKEGVIFQKDYRIDENITITEYVSDPNCDEINPDDSIAVVAVNGNPFELNLTGAVILEGIILNQSVDQIAVSVANLFDISKEQAMTSIQTYGDNLVELGILERKESDL